MPVDWRHFGRSAGIARFAEQTRTMLRRLGSDPATEDLEERSQGVAAHLAECLRPVDLVPPTVIERLDPLTIDRLSRNNRVAVLGEFSAGKSSLVNFLLGEEVLPSGVLATTRRPTLIRHAEKRSACAISLTGEPITLGMENIRMLQRQDVRRIEISLPNDILRCVEILDTPGLADPFQDDLEVGEVVRDAHFAIWCSQASQAWKESERAAWAALPARFRTSGLLVVTHRDILVDERDQGKLLARMEREAAELFHDVALLSVTSAGQALRAQPFDEPLWQSSGAADFMGKFFSILQLVGRQRQRSLLHAAQRSRGRKTGRKRGSPVANGGLAMPAAPPLTGEGQKERALPAKPDTIEAAPRRQNDHLETPGKAVAPAKAQSPARKRDDRPNVPGEALAPAGVDHLMQQCIATLPNCLATGYVDLTSGLLLAVHTVTEHPPALLDLVAAATAEMFQGPNVIAIEELFRRNRGTDDAGHHYFSEIIVTSDNLLHVFVRSRKLSQYVLVVVSRNSVNVGMVLAKARMYLRQLDDLMTAA